MGERGLISYLIVVAFARKREWRLYWKLIAVSLQIASLFADSYEIRVTGPPVACPRVYLSLLTTLLI